MALIPPGLEPSSIKTFDKNWGVFLSLFECTTENLLLGRAPLRTLES
jgi:hypothetical protein